MCKSIEFSTSSLTPATVFLTAAILMGMKRYLTMVFICTSLMANDGEHLVLTGHLNTFIEVMSILILRPHLNWVIYLFITELQEFIYSDYKSLFRYQIYHLQLLFFILWVFFAISWSVKIFMDIYLNTVTETQPEDFLQVLWVGAESFPLEAARSWLSC